MHFKVLRRLGAGVLLFACVAVSPASAQPTFETEAPFAFLVDPSSSTVLFEKAADEQMAPASMAKLMTAEVVFSLIEEGRLSLEDTFSVSENAWRIGGATSGGSTMFLQLNSTVRLEDLLKGIIIQSGNDACIVVAEGIAGSERAFADLMNRRAQEIGLTNSNFTNSTGLPDPDQLVTPRDLARLAEHLIETYPEFYAFYSEREFAWNGITQQNRNPLLGADIGADGLKTGYTAESGYGLVGSAVQDSQRLILVVNGLPTARARQEETQKLMNWGFQAFEGVVLFEAGEPVGEASVFGGTQGGVPLVGTGPISVLAPRGAERDFRARILYDGPVRAPVEQGAEIGRLEVRDGERVVLQAPLFAGASVGRGTLTQRAFDGLKELALGWL